MYRFDIIFLLLVGTFFNYSSQADEGDAATKNRYEAFMDHRSKLSEAEREISSSFSGPRAESLWKRLSQNIKPNEGRLEFLVDSLIPYLECKEPLKKAPVRRINTIDGPDVDCEQVQTGTGDFIVGAFALESVTFEKTNYKCTVGVSISDTGEASIYRADDEFFDSWRERNR